MYDNLLHHIRKKITTLKQISLSNYFQSKQTEALDMDWFEKGPRSKAWPLKDRLIQEEPTWILVDNENN